MNRPTNVRWIVFGLACGTSWVLYLHRYTFALIKPHLNERFGWDETQLGLLDSAFNLAYTLFQVPCGALADILGVRYFLAGMILLWSVALALHALAPNLAAMRAVRALFGIGQAGAYAVLSRITRFWFPASVRTSVQGWVGIFFGRIGGASSNVLFATFLIGTLHLSWQTSLYLFAAGGLALALLFMALFRDSPRQHPWVNDAEVRLIEGGDSVTPPTGPRPRLTFSALLKRTSPRSVLNLLALGLQSFLSTVADTFYVSWTPLFLSKVYGMEDREMGLFSMLPLLGGACGGPAGGYLNDYLIRVTGDRRKARTLVGLIGKGLAAGLLLADLLLYYRQPYSFCVLLFFVKFFGDWSQASTWGTVTDIGGRATATVFAFNNTVGGVGAVLASALFGWMAQYHGWPSVFILVAVVYALCAASWLLIDCTIPVLAEQPTDA
jgi:MFS transporter, ACS family, glucarate transporter